MAALTMPRYYQSISGWPHSPVIMKITGVRPCMDEGLDTGDMILPNIPIQAEDNAGDIDRLSV